MYLKHNVKWKCGPCIKPVARRLALFQEKDEYECYSERYVKCFWGLCDQHLSKEQFITNTEDKVITRQPKKQEILIKHHKTA